MHLAFDLDGVLLDSESDLSWLERAIDSALVALDLPRTEALRSKLFPGSVDAITAVAEEAGVDPDHFWSVRDDHYVRAKLEAIRSRELEPFDDVEVVDVLTQRHDLHIISNSPQVVVDEFVLTNGYDQVFDVRLGRSTGDLAGLRRLKPDPYLYEELVDRLRGQRPSMYVGDTETDRAFATATGMRFVHLTRDSSEPASLRSLPALLE